MSLSPRKRMLLGFLLANAAIIATAAVIQLQRPAAPPQIQGVLLSEARPLQPFSLLDHRGHEFGNADLRGRWHLVTYGFTSCPDICPTLLTQLNAMLDRLPGDELQVLFYSVDHRRDTSEQLAAYLAFFNPDFIGLTHPDDPRKAYLPFEEGLGIVARLVPGEGSEQGTYQVVHGVTLLLLNPRGELQAVFKPRQSVRGVPVFDPDQLTADYLAIRHYLDRETDRG